MHYGPECRRGRALPGRTGHPARPKPFHARGLLPVASPAAGPDDADFRTPVSRRGSRVSSGRKRPSDFLGVVARLARVLRQRKTQVVQTFLFHANFVGRIAAWRAGVPCVVCGIRVAQRHASWHLWLDRMTHRMVDRYVCVSQSVAAFSASTARLPADKLVVIPNGIDLSRFNDVRPADTANLGVTGRRLVTFIGRLDVQKGLRSASDYRGATGSGGCPIATCCWWARVRWNPRCGGNAARRGLPSGSTLPAGGRISRQFWPPAACWC